MAISGQALGELVIEGETGNVHRLVGRYEVYAADGQVYVLAREECVMEHPEHMPLRIPPGAYVVTRVRSLDREEYFRTRRIAGRLTSD